MSYTYCPYDENGQVKIALPALREMAAQAVDDASGIKDMAVAGIFVTVIASVIVSLVIFSVGSLTGLY